MRTGVPFCCQQLCGFATRNDETTHSCLLVRFKQQAKQSDHRQFCKNGLHVFNDIIIGVKSYMDETSKGRVVASACR